MSNSEQKACAFCGIEATKTLALGDPSIDIHQYVCPRCGPYYIAEYGESPVKDTEEGFRLACVAVEWRSKGRGSFTLCGEGARARLEGVWDRTPVIEPDQMLAEYPAPAEVLTRALLNFYRRTSRHFETITYDAEEIRFATYCQERTEAYYLLHHMENRGLLTDMAPERKTKNLRITPDGLSFIRELTRTPLDSDQGFIAMRIDESTYDTWKKGIEPGIKNAGWAPLRIDDEHHNDKICDRIIAGIRQSRFVVVDATFARPAVLFEAGFAKGLGLDVIWVVSKEWLDADEANVLNFDTRQYSHIMYTDPPDLSEKLRDGILATIGRGPVRSE